ncbi:MAG: protein phosphatase CheZ [Alphaproteobacteria bacterium]|nr:protein phosphatase CheZ [Alphaproteobacteria bacterium]
MPHTSSRKPFSAERRSRPTTVSVSAAGAAPAGDFGALVEEIAALRAEMSEMRAMMGGSVPASTAGGPEHNDKEDIKAVQVEIAQLVKSIAKAKAEIAAIKHPMAEDDRLLAASNELDAIVRSTEMATHDILEAAEQIEVEAANLAGLCHDDQDVVHATERIVAQVVRVLEASNFQDITGQRITKVVETVRFIEQRVLAMIDIWGVHAFEDLPLPNRETVDEDEDLLNGPQLENQGISQADIDALFD